MVGDPSRRPAPTGRGTRRRRRRRVPLAVQATDVAGRSIAAAVPLHRLDPRLVNAAAVVEIAAFAALLITASGPALGLVAVGSVVFVGLHLADERAVLAVQHDGEATLLSAGRDGRPVAVRAGSSSPPPLPEPSGLAASVRLDGTRWWIDRAGYPLLAEARTVTAPP